MKESPTLRLHKKWGKSDESSEEGGVEEEQNKRVEPEKQQESFAANMAKLRALKRKTIS